MDKKELEENVRKSINESRVVFDALDDADIEKSVEDFKNGRSKSTDQLIKEMEN